MEGLLREEQAEEVRWLLREEWGWGFRIVGLSDVLQICIDILGERWGCVGACCIISH